MAWKNLAVVFCLMLLFVHNLCHVGYGKITTNHVRVSHVHDYEANLATTVEWVQLQQRIKTARANLDYAKEALGGENERKTASVDQASLLPGQQAKPFLLHTLMGTLMYPSTELANTPIIFHAFDNHSAFLECLWTSKDSLESLARGIPNNTHLIFLPTSDSALKQSSWMKGQLQATIQEMKRHGRLETKIIDSLQSRLHFAVTSLYQLGNWIPSLLQQWACEGHGCGLAQAVFQNGTSDRFGSLSEEKSLTLQEPRVPIVLKRLDARYDWLPSMTKLGNKTFHVVPAKDGCNLDSRVADKIAMVTSRGCSFSKKVSTMDGSKAVAVVVYADPGQPVQDMNCQGADCDSPPGIPATMVPYNEKLICRLQTGNLSVSFQTTPSSNFYFGIDAEGLLQEMGWLLYPSFQFFNWQAQWFNYKSTLLHKLSNEALIIPVIDDAVMQGDKGVVAKIQLPPLPKLAKYNKLELDASLSCPGTNDENCPPWDHTVNLYLCCNKSSHLCNMELGRWITPFRRRIGHWLTNVSPLLPLFTTNNCTFTMKTVSWAKAWKPSLNLRFSMNNTAAKSKPYNITPLYQGGQFDKGYNKKYKPYYFTVPSDAKKVEIYAVITGHGSDNNGCGEFCVTSHHFIVNGHSNNITFSNAGTALGCAQRTPTGVEPNEHGTWLYGRDGWCDGREVDPWVFDVTTQLIPGKNNITYFGWFDGKDPNPTSNPGYIIMYSYLIFYK